MEPAGDGLLRLAFERLKQKLAAEGLFDEAHKKPVPRFPGCIGVITSPTGAAIRDILSVLRRRFPAIPVIVYPVPVQGDAAAPQIAAMIRTADLRRECDVLILSRGGGSLEDLWPFNEEAVARAVHACETPIVSGVGHEIDFTIADFVADLRAPTPSAAAELVSPDAHQWLRHFAMLESRLIAAMNQRLIRRGEQLGWLSRRLVHPGRRLLELAQRLDDLNQRMAAAARSAIQDRRLSLATLSARLQQTNPGHALRLHLQHCAQLQRRLAQAMQQRLQRDQARLGALSRALGAVSPLATLDRGYAIVSADRDGTILRSAAGINRGDRITARLARDRLRCTVEAIENDEEQK
jgi:exodeoxyribonuclease VII large subunit